MNTPSASTGTSLSVSAAASAAGVTAIVRSAIPMSDSLHHIAEEENTPVASTPGVTTTVEVVNLRAPSKLPSRPRKLRKLSPENSSMNSSRTIVTRPQQQQQQQQRSLSCEGEIEIALKHLRGADPNLAKLIDLHKPPSFNSFETPFLALAKSILYQQLAYKAGTSIYSRFVSLCGGESGVVPDTVLSLTPQQLRQIGVSGRKTSYLHDLARKYQNRILSDSAIINMDDKSLFTMLTMVNGIGSWSVHMFMIFSLHRPDVLPVNDLGVRKAVQLLYGLQDLPRPSQMEQLCHKWRPYRSVASWYLWRFMEAKGAPSTSAVITAPHAPIMPSPNPQHQLQHQHQPQPQPQPQYIDPINAVINLGQSS